MCRPAPAGAQTAQPPAAAPAATSWRVTAGLASLSLRDIVRAGPPVDASPVAWRSGGLAFDVRHIRAHATSRHLFEASALVAGHFEYRSPLETLTRPSSDRYRAIEGRYEYRRYFWTDVATRGLDIGLGVQALASTTSIARHVPVDLEFHEQAVKVGPAFVTAARWRRWSRTSLEVAWINGGMLAHVSDGHSDTPGSTPAHWGGGWLTDFSVAVDVRVGSRTALSIQYFHSGTGVLSSRQSWATSRGSLSAGVTYGR